MKLRGFEFEDQTWFPALFRDYMTDYLRFLFHVFKLYDPVLPLIKQALLKVNSHQILDLCSGSGGAMEDIYFNLKHTFNKDIQIILSDLFPSLEVYKQLNFQTNGGISYISTPADASDVPSELNGLRTILRLYKPEEMLQMSKATKSGNYTWISGKVKNKFGLSIAYLVGYPSIENN